MQRKSILGLKILVSLSLLALVLLKIDLSLIVAQLRYLSLQFVVLILLYYTVLQLISCWRWQIVLWATGHSVPMRHLLSSYFAGMFLNIFMPGSFGGDVYRIYRIGREIKDSEVALVSVFLERFTGLAALSTLALLGLPSAFTLVGSWDIILIFVITVGILVLAVLLISSPKLLRLAEPWLEKFRLGNLAARFAKIQILLLKFSKHRRGLAFSIGLSFLLMLGIVYYHYLLTQQLNIQISYLELLVFIPIVAVITLLPISLGGLGVKEGLWVYLFIRIGLTAEAALLLSLTMTALSWLLSLPGGLVLLLDSISVRQIK